VSATLRPRRMFRICLVKNTSLGRPWGHDPPGPSASALKLVSLSRAKRISPDLGELQSAIGGSRTYAEHAGTPDVIQAENLVDGFKLSPTRHGGEIESIRRGTRRTNRGDSPIPSPCSIFITERLDWPAKDGPSGLRDTHTSLP
jgi:hypothetical protein